MKPVLADYRSDYEYQYNQYRQNYIEYSVLKKDFLNNPTLDNQQKAVLVAKETLKARDLAKASYAAYLLSLIQEKKISYHPINLHIVSLQAAHKYFLSEAQKSQSIITSTDLKAFSEEYSKSVLTHNRSFRTGVIANKIADLVRFQLDGKEAFNTILPKLASPFSTSLADRINELQLLGNRIDNDVDNLATKVSSEEDMDNIDNETYFTNKTEAVRDIQKLQLKWIDGLIDIDINYAHS
jgi:hypothetical protein